MVAAGVGVDDKDGGHVHDDRALAMGRVALN